RGQVVTEHRRGIGEAAAGELHAVPGIPSEANDYAFAFFNRLGHGVTSATHPLTNCTRRLDVLPTAPSAPTLPRLHRVGRSACRDAPRHAQRRRPQIRPSGR